ncbi:MAG: anthranilate synthase component I family protein, partial [Bacteroidaceae bacterium]|nr:anthranilate synthase component I family protein [Bacteroidaceae bacterium]
MSAYKFHFHTASKKILGDLITPVSAYLKVRDAYPQSALMESSDYHGGENAKSFIALHPIASVSIEHGIGFCRFPDGTEEHFKIGKSYDTARLISDFLACFNIEGNDVNYCGLYGYTTFNAVRYFENIAVKDETQPENDAPDMLYILYKDVVVFDHFRNELTLIELL